MRIESGLAEGQVIQRVGDFGSVCLRLYGLGNLNDINCQVKHNDIPVCGVVYENPEPNGNDVLTLVISRIPSGGPYSLEIIEKGEKSVIREFYCGDVWLMAGQSNMEGLGALAEAPEPDFRVRSFSMARRWGLAKEPIHFLAESPDPIHFGEMILSAQEIEKRKASANRGCGLGLHFGKIMAQKTGVPQGLIACAHGGTSMAQWDPKLKDMAGASLYGSMMLSLKALGQRIAGVLWYQGCSDTNPEDVQKYQGRMQELVTALRRDIGQDDVPWICAQIAKEVGREWNIWQWHQIQDIQSKLPSVIENLDVASTADLEQDDWIHISTRAHATLAKRFSVIADYQVLKLPGTVPSPRLRSVSWFKDDLSPGIELRWDNVVGGLHSDGLPSGFFVAEPEGKGNNIVYQTRLDGDTVRLRLSSDELANRYVFHGLGTEAQISIHDGRGMALPIFGPVPIEGFPPYSPWFRHWRVGPIAAGEDIRALNIPTETDLGKSECRVFTGWWMVNLQPEWQGKTGHCAFGAKIMCPEDMALDLLLGYDAPFKLWIDGEMLHYAAEAAGPAIQDSVRIPVKWTKGLHQVRVWMSLSNGKAWGFFMRAIRTDGGKSYAESIL